MAFCTSSEFWVSFCANALSDIVFGVLFGTLFGFVATRTLARVLERHNTANLILRARQPGTVKLASPVHDWPPKRNAPAYADVQFVLENAGRVAATNWLVVLRFSHCDGFDQNPLFQILPIEDPFDRTKGPLVSRRHETTNEGSEIIRLQYASDSDIVHSHLSEFQPDSMRLRVYLHEGFETAMRYRTDHSRDKQGTCRIYADHMKMVEQTAKIILELDKPDQPLISIYLVQGNTYVII